MNIKLLEERNIDRETAFKIAELHALRNTTILNMHYSNDIEAVKVWLGKLSNIEFKLQELWGFDKNEDFHRLVGKGHIPKCECPPLDNLDAIGSGSRVYSEDCPLHN